VAEDSFGLATKVLVWKDLLQRLPRNMASWRKADIAVHKLERMVEAFNRKFPPTMLLAMTNTKLRRAQGPDRHRLAQQSKLVDELVSSLLSDALLQDLGDNMPQKARKRLPEAARKYVRKLNRDVYQHSQKMLRAALQEGIKGLSGVRRPES
jgi:hypothetical protein